MNTIDSIDTIVPCFIFHTYGHANSTEYHFDISSVEHNDPTLCFILFIVNILQKGMIFFYSELV